MEIPVPIPNTEVKHSNVENSGSEDRKLPFFFALDKKNIIEDNRKIKERTKMFHKNLFKNHKKRT